MKEDIIREKTYKFALKVISIYKILIYDKKEFVLSKQLLKSGTSPGALVMEAEFAQSKLDFISKMSIALKEANESIYWTSLLRDSGFITTEAANDLIKDAQEIVRLLVASIKTAKSNLKNKS